MDADRLARIKARHHLERGFDKDVADLVAEVERLQALENANYPLALREANIEVERLQAENVRLRAALPWGEPPSRPGRTA